MVSVADRLKRLDRRWDCLAGVQVDRAHKLPPVDGNTAAEHDDTVCRCGAGGSLLLRVRGAAAKWQQLSWRARLPHACCTPTVCCSMRGACRKRSFFCCGRPAREGFSLMVAAHAKALLPAPWSPLRHRLSPGRSSAASSLARCAVAASPVDSTVNWRPVHSSGAAARAATAARGRRTWVPAPAAPPRRAVGAVPAARIVQAGCLAARVQAAQACARWPAAETRAARVGAVAVDAACQPLRREATPWVASSNPTRSGLFDHKWRSHGGSGGDPSGIGPSGVCRLERDILVARYVCGRRGAVEQQQRCVAAYPQSRWSAR